MEGIEKVICCDRGSNDALAYAAMANKQDPMAMMAAMNGGMNSWNNSPWMYLTKLSHPKQQSVNGLVPSI